MYLSIGILLFILPLIYIPFIFNPYESSKFVVFVALTLVIGIIHFSKKDRLQSFSKKADLLTILIVLYGIIVLVSDLFGMNVRNSILGSGFRFQGFITLFCSILLFFIVKDLKIKDSKFFEKAKTAIFFGAFFICLFSFWQSFVLYILHHLSVPNYQGRIVGTIGNPNSLAGYLVIVLSLLLFAKNKNYKHLILALMILSVILLTQSRGAILAAGLVFVVYIAKFIKRFMLGKSILIIFAGIGLSIFTFQTNRNSIWDNRNLIWGEGVKAVVNKPILGHGQENFELVFPKERHMFVDSAHNIFLETAVSSGLVGLTIFLAIVFIALKRADLSLKMALLVFLISAQFNPLSISQIALFWFLLGFIP